MRLVFSPRAKQDLDEIEAYIGHDNPPRAVTFVEEIIQFCTSLTDMPHRHPIYEASSLPTVRRAIFGNYLIFYRADDNVVDIVHVRHGAREPIVFSSDDE